MDRLKKEIHREGEFIGMGGSRAVYFWKGYIWKIPHSPEGTQQSLYEELVYSSVIKSKPSLSRLFPNPMFFGNIVRAEQAEPMEVSSSSLSGMRGFADLVDFFRIAKPYNLDTKEIVNTSGNAGKQGSQLKILDWGMSTKPHLILNISKEDFIKRFGQTQRRYRNVNNSH